MHCCGAGSFGAVEYLNRWATAWRRAVIDGIDFEGAPPHAPGSFPPWDARGGAGGGGKAGSDGGATYRYDDDDEGYESSGGEVVVAEDSENFDSEEEEESV